MAASLSELLRSVLSNHNEFITLWEEKDYIENYLTIERFKYRRPFTVLWDVEEELWSYPVPKLLLQPVVENAMVHGLSKKEQGGRVHVRIWEQGKRLVISVADTGLGMSEECLAEVTEAMKERRTSRIGIGLGNIYKRIHMMYKQGEFRIASIEGRGTVIQMFIPQEKHNRGDK